MNNIYIYDSNNKRLDRNNYYVAKYVYEIDELNTDLSESELNLCNKILEGVLM